MSIADDLKKLAELLEAGHLTAEEYETAKKKLLAPEAPREVLPDKAPEGEEGPLELEAPEPLPPAGARPAPNRSGTSVSTPAHAGSPWKGIDDVSDDEEEELVARYRQNPMHGSGLVVLALCLISCASLVQCLVLYNQSRSRDSNIFNGLTLYPLVSHSTTMLLAAAAAVAFGSLVVLAWRLPFIAGALGLTLYLVLGIGSTVLAFNGVDKALADTETNWAESRGDSGRGDPARPESARRVTALSREEAYEKLYFRYGVGWAIRTPLVILLLIGLIDNWPRLRRDE